MIARHRLAILLLLLIPSAVLAQATAPSDDPESARVGGPQSGELFHEPRGLDVITEAELAERPWRTVTDALDEETGAHGQHTNRGSGAPSIRGQVGPSNLLAFDGIRIDNGTSRTGPNQLTNLYDPFALARIEVLRGPGGVGFGSDSLGGVIHFVPRPLTYERGVTSRATVRYLSADDAVTLAPEVAWSNATWSLVGGGALGFFDTLREGGGALLPASDYRQFSAHARVGWRPSSAAALSLSYFGTWVLDAGRVDRLYDNSYREYDNANHLVYTRFASQGEGALREVYAVLSFGLTNEAEHVHRCALADVYGLTDTEGAPLLTSADPAGCVDDELDALRGAADLEDTVLTVGLSSTIRTTLPLPGLELSWGLDAYQSFVDSSGLELAREDGSEPTFVAADTRGNFSDGSRYGYYGAFAEIAQDVPLADGWLARLAFGLRLTHVRAFAPDVPDLGDIDHNDTGVTGSAQLAFLRHEQVTLFGGLSQGFRPPNLQELSQIGDTGTFFEVPNDDLRPERAQQYEVGGRALFGLVFVDLVGYVLEIRDVIAREPATFRGLAEVEGAPVGQRVNADDASYFGVELSVSWRAHEHLVLRGNFAFLDGTLRVARENFEPSRAPPLRWLAAVRFEWPRPSLYAELLVRGAAAQDDLNGGDEADLRICGSRQFRGLFYSELGEDCPGTAGWAELGFRAGMTLLDHMDLRFSLSNLLDARYRLHGSGFDAPGFEAVFSLAYRL